MQLVIARGLPRPAKLECTAAVEYNTMVSSSTRHFSIAMQVNYCYVCRAIIVRRYYTAL